MPSGPISRAAVVEFSLPVARGRYSIFTKRALDLVFRILEPILHNVLWIRTNGHGAMSVPTVRGPQLSAQRNHLILLLLCLCADPSDFISRVLGANKLNSSLRQHSDRKSD